MERAAYVYPWDILDDPAAASELARLGVDSVSVAAAYHSVRALMPRNPRRTVLTAPHAAAYFPVDDRRFADTRLRPLSPGWVPADAFSTARDRLAGEGLAVDAWMVLTHNTALATRHPGLAVRNCVGEPYAHALCPAQPEVRAYAAGLVGSLVDHTPVDRLELEACGYLGVRHDSHHDKAGVALSALGEFALSVCCCEACAAHVDAEGGDLERIAGRLREQLPRLLSGAVADESAAPFESQLAHLLGRADSEALLSGRDEATYGLLDAATAGIGSTRRPSVLLHVAPRRHQTGAAVGGPLPRLAERVDALVGVCHGQPPERAAASVRALLEQVSGQRPVLANVELASALRPEAELLPPTVSAVASAGASGVRLYHAGLATTRQMATARGLFAR